MGAVEGCNTLIVTGWVNTPQNKRLYSLNKSQLLPVQECGAVLRPVVVVTRMGW